ncbi:MAG: DUF3566 domain-containing protein [Micrococcales bacterium]|nr:DUF3566 domain-containing protein [Micrococcales bacterium]
MSQESEGKAAVRRKPTARPGSGEGGPRTADAVRRAKPSSAGHAMEPPPVIRPKSKPARATGAVKTVGSGKAYGAQMRPGGPRSFRTAKAATPAPVPPGEAPSLAPPPVDAAGQPAASSQTTAVATAPPVLGAPPVPTPAPVPVDGEAGRLTLPQRAPKKAKKGGATVAGVASASQDAKGLRRIKLQLKYVSPLSVAKISFLIMLAAGVAFVVMVYVLWHALDNKAVFSEINNMIIDLAGAPKARELDLLRYVERGRVMSGAMTIAAIDVVIGTVLATFGAIIYNLIAALLGGVHLTLQEK